MEKVSVIIPVRNAALYIRQCIDSVLSQSYKNIEVLIMDDGSTDETPQICDEYARTDKRVIVSHKINNGVGASRNRGIVESTGDFLMFVDADDYLYDDCVIEIMVKKMLSDKADIVITDYSRLINNELLPARRCSDFMKYENQPGKFGFSGFFSAGNLAYAWAKLYRTSFLLDNFLEFKKFTYAEDKQFNIMAFFKGAKYSYADIEGYVYRMNTKSVSFTYRENNYKNWLGIAQSLQEYIDETGQAEEYGKIVGYIIFFAAFFDGKEEYCHAKKVKTMSGYKAIKLNLKRYADEELSKYYFKRMAKGYGIKDIDSLLYKIMLRGFAICMRFSMHGVIALGIKMLIDLKVDVRLSDTKKR